MIPSVWDPKANFHHADLRPSSRGQRSEDTEKGGRSGCVTSAMGARQWGASGKLSLLVAVLLAEAAGRHPSRAAMLPCVCSPLGASPHLAAVPASMQLRGGGRVRHDDGGLPGAEDSDVSDKEDAEQHEHLQGDSLEKELGRGQEGDKQAGRNGRTSHDK